MTNAHRWVGKDPRHPTVVLGPMLLQMVVAGLLAGGVGAQMCPTTLRPVGAVSVDLGAQRSWSAPTLAVRWVGSRLWGGAGAGRTEPNASYSRNVWIPDESRSYDGLVEYQFLGAGGELGWSTKAGSRTLCFSVSGKYSWQTDAVYERFPQSARTQLDSEARTSVWEVRDELSLDFPLGERAALGVGAFLRHGAFNLQGPRPSATDGGGSAGFGALLSDRVLLAVKYYRATGMVWLDGSISWIFW